MAASTFQTELLELLKNGLETVTFRDSTDDTVTTDMLKNDETIVCCIVCDFYRNHAKSNISCDYKGVYQSKEMIELLAKYNMVIEWTFDMVIAMVRTFA